MAISFYRDIIIRDLRVMARVMARVMVSFIVTWVRLFRRRLCTGSFLVNLSQVVTWSITVSFTLPSLLFSSSMRVSVVTRPQVVWARRVEGRT
ncbi:hypothetical protein H4582DRAFT_1145335 [Lactarius indigo]|nr:hypothetical protein H4582DRAFT_1145335 [Lactarius indigo]